MKNKKAQIVQDWLVHALYYIALLLVLALIVWALLSGKLNELWVSLMQKLRFF